MGEKLYSREEAREIVDRIAFPFIAVLVLSLIATVWLFALALPGINIAIGVSATAAIVVGFLGLARP